LFLQQYETDKFSVFVLKTMVIIVIKNIYRI